MPEIRLVVVDDHAPTREQVVKDLSSGDIIKIVGEAKSSDEALKLARVVGVNFDEQLRNKVLEIKGGDVIVWDSGQRAKKGAIASMTSICRLDALHHAAQAVREKNVGIAKDLIERAEMNKDNAFMQAMEAMLNVLPTPRMVSGKGALAGAAADAEALEKLRKLMFATEVPQAKQWTLFDQPEAARP